MSIADGTPLTFVVRQGDETRRSNAIRALDRWIAEGNVEVTFAPYTPKMSHPQRNLFWKWCDLFAKAQREAGFACCDEAVHDEFLASVFGWEEQGFSRRRPRRTLTRPKALDKIGMMEVLTRFDVWASEHGVMLPRPATWDADVAEANRLKALQTQNQEETTCN